MGTACGGASRTTRCPSSTRSSPTTDVPTVEWCLGDASCDCELLWTTCSFDPKSRRASWNCQYPDEPQPCGTTANGSITIVTGVSTGQWSFRDTWCAASVSQLLWNARCIDTKTSGGSRHHY